MPKYKLANGWTKAKVMERVREYNNGNRAISENGICAYQAFNGNRCAIGCFIPDDHPAFITSIVGPVEVLIQNFPELKPLMPFNDSIALQAFQSAHDYADSIQNVHEKIEEFLNFYVGE